MCLSLRSHGFSLRKDLGCRVWGSGFRGLGFRDLGFGGSGFRVKGLGVQGLGMFVSIRGFEASTR